MQRAGGYRGTGYTGEQGALELRGLRADRALTVVVPAPIGPPLVEQRIEPLAERERREVTLVEPGATTRVQVTP